jgi:hypothetical protein
MNKISAEVQRTQSVLVFRWRIPLRSLRLCGEIGVYGRINGDAFRVFRGAVMLIGGLMQQCGIEKLAVADSRDLSGALPR